MSRSMFYLLPPFILSLPPLLPSLGPCLLPSLLAIPSGVTNSDQQVSRNDGFCNANQLQLRIKLRIQRIINSAYAEVRGKKIKERLQLIKEMNKKDMKKIMLLETCTVEPEKKLEMQLRELKKPISTKRFKRWIIYCVKMWGQCKAHMLFRNTPRA